MHVPHKGKHFPSVRLTYRATLTVVGGNNNNKKRSTADSGC